MLPLLRRLHRWLGLAFMLPMLLQGVTGSTLVVLSLSKPGRPQVAASGAASQQVAAIVRAARQGVPSTEALLRYSPARWPGDSAEVGFGHVGSRNPGTLVLVDPGSASVLATRHAGGFGDLVRRLHTALLLPMPLGRTLIGWVGIALLTLSILGIPLWWPRPAGRRLASLRRNAAIARRARGPRLWRELHVALGTWTALMILLMSGSGIVMSFPQTTRAVLGLPTLSRPDFGDRKRPDFGDHGRRGPAADGVRPPDAQLVAGLDETIAGIGRTLPGLSSLEVSVAVPPAPLMIRYTMQGRGGAQSARVDRDGVVHPMTKGGTGWRDGIVAWSHLLHEAKVPLGAVAATAWSVLVGLTGVSLALFSVSGFLVWLLRRRRRVE